MFVLAPTPRVITRCWRYSPACLALVLMVAVNLFSRPRARDVSPQSPFALAVFSVYMSKKGAELHYSYLDLTMASMGMNPNVDFILIHVVPDGEDRPSATPYLSLDSQSEIPANVRVERYTYSQLSALVSRRLKINVEFSSEWSYKLAEYKPTFGHLFEDHLINSRTGKSYDWWGYADLDLVWGNISHFSGLFASPEVYPIVHSGWRAPRGMAAFFANKPWTRLLYRQDPMYLHLLQNSTYMNLDENGVSTVPEAVVNDGKHSLAYFQWSALEQRGKGEKVFGGKTAKDRLFLEKIDSVSWAGPVVWRDGELRVVREFFSAEDNFPANRQLLFYHRADDSFQIPRGIPRSAWVGEMLQHGFLLPYFTPLLSRFICQDTASREFHGKSLEELVAYQPYKCLGKE